MRAAAAVSLLERDDALQVLQALATASATQRGQLAVISGEAGIGKSSLVAGLAATIRTDAVVAWGFCDDLFTPRELGPFHDMAEQLGTEVSAALSCPSPPAALFPAILRAINALPDGSLLIIEDMHWADTASLDLLKFIARRLIPLRVMLVLTYRPDETVQPHPLASLLGDLPSSITTRLPLSPLSRQAVDRLAANHGRDGGELFSTTGGNPFFLSEILAQPVEDKRLPASIRDAVLTRAARSSPVERRLLDALCVAPDPVPLAMVTQLMGDDGVAASAALEMRGLLLRDSSDGLRFRHALARRAILEALPAPERHEHHRRLLAAYLALGNAFNPELILHHAEALNDADLILAPSCTEALTGYSRVRIGAMARALEAQCVTVMASTVGAADWSPAVDANTGTGGIFGPPDTGFPPTGVIAEGALDTPGWTVAEVDLGAVAHVRADGVVLNRRHWDDQVGRDATVTPGRLR